MISSLFYKKNSPDGLENFVLFEFEIFINSHLPDELIDMRDEDHRTFVLIECFRDYGKVAEVDMIRWLIEDEKTRFFEGKFREHDESFLSFRECTHGSIHDFTRDEKPARK